MGVLEDAKIKKVENKKIPANEPRILEIRAAIKPIVKNSVNIYYKNVSVNEKGFYNGKSSDGSICIPKNAVNLKDDELLALMLAESLFSANAEKRSLDLGMCYMVLALSSILMIPLFFINLTNGIANFIGSFSSDKPYPDASNTPIYIFFVIIAVPFVIFAISQWGSKYKPDK